MLPDAGNAHYIIAIKTETGYRTEAAGTANAKKLMDAFVEVSNMEKHKDGEPLLYPSHDISKP